MTLAAGATQVREEVDLAAENIRSPYIRLSCFRQDTNTQTYATHYTKQYQQQSRLNFFSGLYGYIIIIVTIAIAIKVGSSASTLL